MPQVDYVSPKSVSKILGRILVLFRSFFLIIEVRKCN